MRRVVHAHSQTIGIELADGSVKTFDHVISSMPITDLVSRMDGVPQTVSQALGRLRFRNTVIVFLRIQGPDLFKDNWLYVHSAGLATGRITNFRNWTPHIYGTQSDTVLALEYWCYHEDCLWRLHDEDIRAQAVKDLTASGLLKNRAVLDGHIVRIENSYPVYARGYKEPLAVVADYLKTVRNLSLIGRYGAFKYNNQDHSMLMGLLAAQNIAKGERHNLWAINTDYEYQESSVITKVGLVEKAR